MKRVMYPNYVFYIFFFMVAVANGKEMDKEEVDKVIEDEITHKLSEDLLQSIEKKFYVDLERSVDSVLIKIKLLLQNGTSHIHEKLVELQNIMDVMQNDTEKEVETCLQEYSNETTALAEKTLHQMVVCGYALIGHDPAQAVRNVMELKAMIKNGLKPIYNQREEVYNLLKVCGHDHDTLKKVIKCVISKSPQIKSAMMSVSSKLIDGVVQLTKQMAHGAMHEACLIEVIKTIEDEAFVIVSKVKKCTTNSTSQVLEETEKYIKQNNATILDLEKRGKKIGEKVKSTEDKPTKDNGNSQIKDSTPISPDDVTKTTLDAKQEENLKTILRRMLKHSKTQEDVDKVKKTKAKVQNDVAAAINNALNDVTQAD